MKRIEIGLIKVHEAARESGDVPEGTTAVSGTAPFQSVDPFAAKTPFSRVQSVAEGSPAASAELKVGDLIIQFGSASFDTSAAPMQGLKDIVFHSENKPLELIARRGEEIVRLTLVPKKWSGAGLLGCHILPV